MHTRVYYIMCEQTLFLSFSFSICLGTTLADVNNSFPMAQESPLFHVHSWNSVSKGFKAMNSTNFEEKAGVSLGHWFSWFSVNLTHFGRGNFN